MSSGGAWAPSNVGARDTEAAGAPGMPGAVWREEVSGAGGAGTGTGDVPMPPGTGFCPYESVGARAGLAPICATCAADAGLFLRERGHLVDELLRVERLVHEVVRADLRAPIPIVRLLLVREDDHREPGLRCLQVPAQVVAARALEPRVNQRDSGPFGELRNGFVRTRAKDQAKVLAGEGDFKHLTHRFTVVDR